MPPCELPPALSSSPVRLLSPLRFAILYSFSGLFAPDSDIQTLLPAVRSLRKQVTGTNALLQTQVVAVRGAVPRLLHFLRAEFDTNSELQIETCWVLTNLSCGSHEVTAPIVDHGGVQLLLRLARRTAEATQLIRLKNETSALLENAVWTLSNIAGDCVEYRDRVTPGLLPVLVPLLAEQGRVHPELAGVCSHALSPLLRLSPPPAMDVIQKATPVLIEMLDSDVSEVVVNALWALSSIVNYDAYIQHVIDLGVLPRAIELASAGGLKLLDPTISLLGSIASVSVGIADRGGHEGGCYSRCSSFFFFFLFFRARRYSVVAGA